MSARTPEAASFCCCYRRLSTPTQRRGHYFKGDNNKENSYVNISFTMSRQESKIVTMSDWHSACELYEHLKKSNPKLSQAAFLRSDASGDKFTDCKTHKNRFGICLKQFKAGTLEKSDLTRQKSRKYTSIEKKLIAYVTARSLKYEQEKRGLSFVRMRSMCLKWAQEDGLSDFKCSNGWICDTLRRYDKTQDVDVMNKEIDEILESLDNGTEKNDCETVNDEGKDKDDAIDVDVPKTTKIEALQAIDILKKYCTEKNAPANVNLSLRELEDGLMDMRLHSATIQRSLSS